MISRYWYAWASAAAVVLLWTAATAHDHEGEFVHNHEHGHHHGHHHHHTHDGPTLQKYPATAIALTFFSGLAATLGGIMVVTFGIPSPAVLGHMLSFASGIMMYISFGDLLKHSEMAVGSMHANLALFGGMLFFWVVVTFVPEPELEELAVHEVVASEDTNGHSSDLDSDEQNREIIEKFRVHSVEQLKQVCREKDLPTYGTKDTLIERLTTPRKETRRKSVSRVNGMERSNLPYEDLYVTELKEHCRERGLPVWGRKDVLVERLVGQGTDKATTPTRVSQRLRNDVAGENRDQQATVESTSNEPKIDKRRLYMTGLIAAIGISLHNFPEGLIVYSQTITGICDKPLDSFTDLVTGQVSMDEFVAFLSSCTGRGLAITFAIALHNIPEGMAVASPIYASSGSKWTALKWCIISSLCEPAAAVLLVPFTYYLTPYVIGILNAVVAGIMIMLCIVELIPTSMTHLSSRAAALSNVAGMFLMYVSIETMVRSGVH